MSPEEIKRRRLAYPLSTAKLGQMIGISQTAINHWEAGRRTPSYQCLRLLEAAFGLRAWSSVNEPRLCTECGIVPVAKKTRYCGACTMRRWRASKGAAA